MHGAGELVDREVGKMTRPAASLLEVRAEPARRRLTSAMAWSGAASLASGLLSILAQKVVAAVTGPSGLALLATLQQIRQIAVVAATLNGQTAVVQGLSARADRSRGREPGEYARTAAMLFAVATAAAATILVAARETLARWAGLGASGASLVGWLAAPVVLSSVFVFLAAVAGALGRIRSLAVLQLVSPAVMALAAYPAALAVRGGRHGWFPALLGAAAAASALSAGWTLRKDFPRLAVWFGGTGKWWNAPAASDFLAVSGSILLTGLAGSVALAAVRSRILATDGWTQAGRFDAAWAISMNQVTLVLGSLQTYCLPWLAQAPNAEERSAHLSALLSAAAAVSAPVIAAIAFLAPAVIALFYAPAFGEAARYLRWTLVGDYFKVASWILSVFLLAAADRKGFVAADLAAYGMFLAAALALGQWRGPAEGAAMAFPLAYATHLAFCGARAWRRHGFRPRRKSALLWLAGLGVVGGTAAVCWEAR
jgi:PST family polysaccharide transporter